VSRPTARPQGKRGPRKPKKLPVYLNERERELILKAAAATSPRGVPLGSLRDTALISLGVFTGLRVAELAGLDRHDVDLHDLEVRVRHGKGDKERIVPLHLGAAIAVEEYIAARVDLEPALFLSRLGRRADVRTLRNVVYRVAREAALTKKISPHKLRHTFATLLYEKSGDLLVVKDLLGHESLVTTQIYTHTTTGRHRRAIDEL
jgi:integrase/recombinase XerD